MEHLARGGVICLGATANVMAAAVGAIACERETEMLEVNANLVGAAGVEHDLDKGGGAEAFEHAETGACFATFAGIGDGHGAAMGWMARDRGLDFTGSFWEFAAENGVINLFHRAIAELVGKAEVRDIVFGNDQTAAGILVDTMNDAGARVTGDAAELAGAVVEQRVNESMLVIPGARVNDKIRWLIDDEEVAVFKENIERNFLGDQFEFFGFRPMNMDDVPCFWRVGGFDLAVVDFDVACINELLESSPGDGGELGAKVIVEPFTRERTLDRDGIGAL